MELRARPELHDVQLVRPVLSHLRGILLKSLDSTDLKLSKPTIRSDEDFSVSVTVHNTGEREGKEVVQVRPRFKRNLEVALIMVSYGHVGLHDRSRQLCCHPQPGARRVPEGQPCVRLLSCTGWGARYET